MDCSSTPTITFTPGVASTLTSGSGSWNLAGTVYTWKIGNFTSSVGPGYLFPAIAAVFFGFAGYVVIDQHEADPINAIKRSIALVKPKFGPLLGLLCLLALINIVGVLLCFVGLLVTYPLTAVAMAYTYRSLSGQPIAPAR